MICLYYARYCFKGCYPNFEVNIIYFLNVASNETYLPCIKQYVLGQCRKSIKTITNNLTDSCFICSDF